MLKLDYLYTYSLIFFILSIAHYEYFLKKKQTHSFGVYFYVTFLLFIRASFYYFDF